MVSVRPGHVMCLKGVCDMPLLCGPKAIVTLLGMWHWDMCHKNYFFLRKMGVLPRNRRAMHVWSCRGSVSAESRGGHPSSQFCCWFCFLF